MFAAYQSGGVGSSSVSNPVTPAQGGLGADNSAADGFPKFVAGTATVAPLSADDIPLMAPAPTTGDGLHYALDDPRITGADGEIFAFVPHVDCEPYAVLSVNADVERDLVVRTSEADVHGMRAGWLKAGQPCLAVYSATYGYYFVVSAVAATIHRSFEAELSSQTFDVNVPYTLALEEAGRNDLFVVSGSGNNVLTAIRDCVLDFDLSIQDDTSGAFIKALVLVDGSIEAIGNNSSAANGARWVFNGLPVAAGQAVEVACYSTVAPCEPRMDLSYLKRLRITAQ